MGEPEVSGLDGDTEPPGTPAGGKGDLYPVSHKLYPLSS